MSPARPGIPRKPGRTRPGRSTGPAQNGRPARDARPDQNGRSGQDGRSGRPPARGTAPLPLERPRAAGLLGGLLLFGLGFAVAALASATGAGGQALYLAGVVVGFGGAALVAVFLNRGTVPLPEAPIWSPTGLRVLARALDLPAPAVMVVVYALIAAGLVGNLLLPLLGG